MNLRSLIGMLFGREYVVLYHHDGEAMMRRAYARNDAFYADPYGAATRTKLLPGGEVQGRPYISFWRPITKKARQLYEAKAT